ncbi:paraslipin, partial [candidate division KSB1 bacterium]|nr:paraslipin [candidate division KSB1 bacterium]
MLPSQTIILIGIIFIVFVVLLKAARVVPQKTVYIIERLGKYHATLDAGFHLLVPFIDRVAYIHSLKEKAIDVPEQSCITKDNIQVQVDGILYLVIIDPVKASYGINDYAFGSIQLSQTTMRSEIGKIELDKTFEEREKINMAIVDAVDKASDP